MASSLETWALPRLQQLLPLDDESLRQVIQYANTLPKDAAAEHLKNLLGDEAKSLEFISSFNMRRQNAPASSRPQPSNSQSQSTDPTPSSSNSEVPKGGRRPQKKKANIHSLPPRQLDSRGNVSGGYQKSAVEDYMPNRQKHKDQVAGNLALNQTPDATKLPLITDDASLTTQPITSKPPPSASGPLISDSLAGKRNGPAKSSAQSSRTSSPAPKAAKVNISGGTAMHGASTALSDLDSAIRSLEMQTNPSLAGTSTVDNDKRKCNCLATRHPLLDMAPNCMSCGKIICVKEGLGPCTFCGSQLLSSDEIQKVLRVLKDERGEERMKVNNAAHKRPDVAQGKAKAYTGREFLAQASSTRSSPFSSQPVTPAGSDDEAGAKAKAHRDKLLGFQANNARRTQIHDEAADYDVPSAGTNMWASPEERAKQLKKQQKIMREMEWNAKPEYEKRRVVASIDLKGGKVVRRMAEVEKPDFEVPEEADEGGDYQPPTSTSGGGAFSNNPLASGLIRPTAREDKGKEAVREKKSTWRRVQMDEDNEQWILDGGVYGNQPVDNPLGEEEHPCG
ncbi:hypothetical protein PRZ48_001754 [Zasmidium cellare]|uniref:TRIP4/RQT4 C2HC5-type zinc finger domain-containing protein n=1 Tax=Zasmidium cellare TaxID=395010 RepID=A0ABR0F348_ZASCE|nr:hypothetical protein PRZ48_001754 [Zasmidium cellare]